MYDKANCSGPFPPIDEEIIVKKLVKLYYFEETGYRR
jgi:hypothetical protein